MFREDRREAIEEIICVVREGNVFLALRGAQGVTQCLSVCPPVKFWVLVLGLSFNNHKHSK